MKKVIALAGNPNCGKTTLFNKLTRSNQHIGNWPGVTVEHKSGLYYGDKELEIVDLPGTYSLTPLSVEEVVARNYLMSGKADLILNVVDVTNLERNLYLTSQLTALDVPVVIALNMIDEAAKKGIVVNEKDLSDWLGCPVMSISAVNKTGIDDLMRLCKEYGDSKHNKMFFDEKTENGIKKIEQAFADILPDKNRRWATIKLLEGDTAIAKELGFDEEKTNKAKEISQQFASEVGENADSYIATLRYAEIGKKVTGLIKFEKPDRKSLSDKIDAIVTNKWLAFPIFALAMFTMFFVSIQSLGAWTVTGMEFLVDKLKEGVFSLMDGKVAPWFTSLIVDGIITGVGGIIVYVPQIMILFGFISVFDACGYMSRVAFIMDRLLHSVGLSGKSLIPMIVGCGCSVPGVLGARTIKDKKERDFTIMLVPFMPCSAKLVMFSYFTTAVFGGNALAATSMYFISIVTIICAALVLKLLGKKFARSKGDSFVMELPPYRWPRPVNVLREMWERGKAFIIKAGTIIFLASIILWLLQNFDYKFNLVDDRAQSLMAYLGKGLRYLFIPLGFGEWQYAVATVSGLAAKETVVVTLEILGAPAMSKATAYSFMIFNLLCCPCVATVSATFKELGSKKLGLFTVLFQCATAYVVSLVFYQMSRLYNANAVAFGTTVGMIVLAAAVAIVALVLIKNKKAGKRMCSACSGGCAGCSLRECPSNKKKK